MHIVTSGTRGGMCTSVGKDFGIHTPCVGAYYRTQYTNSDTAIIFDCGSGIVSLGAKLLSLGFKKFHIFMSHYHLDHIMGFPFFPALWASDTEVTIYGMGDSDEDVKETFATMFGGKYFPVAIDDYQAKLSFKALNMSNIEEAITLGVYKNCAYEYSIKWMYGNHPGDGLIYSVKVTHGACSTDPSSKTVYLSDYENIANYKHSATSCTQSQLEMFLQGTRLLIAEAQFTDLEYPSYRGFGHSTIEEMIKLSTQCGVGHLVVTHHDSRRTSGELTALGKVYTAGLRLTKNKLKMTFAKDEDVFNVYKG